MFALPASLAEPAGEQAGRIKPRLNFAFDVVKQIHKAGRLGLPDNMVTVLAINLIEIGHGQRCVAGDKHTPEYVIRQLFTDVERRWPGSVGR